MATPRSARDEYLGAPAHSARQWPAAEPAEHIFYTPQPRPLRRADSMKSIRKDASTFFDVKVMGHHRLQDGNLRRDASAPAFRPGLSADKLLALEQAGVKPVARDCSPWSAGDRYGIFEADVGQDPAGEEQSMRQLMAERRHFFSGTRAPPFAIGGESQAASSSGLGRGRSATRSQSLHELPVAGFSYVVSPEEYERHPNQQRRHFSEERGVVELDDARPNRRHFQGILAETQPPTPRGSGRKRFEEIPGAAAKPARSGRRHFAEEVFGVTEEQPQDPMKIGRKHFADAKPASACQEASVPLEDSRWGILQYGDAAAGMHTKRPARRMFDNHRAAVPASLREDGSASKAIGFDRGRRRTSRPLVPASEEMTVGYNTVQKHTHANQTTEDRSERPRAAGVPQWNIGMARGSRRNEGILGLGGGKRRIDSFYGGGTPAACAVEKAPPPLRAKQPLRHEAQKAGKQSDAKEEPPPQAAGAKPAWR